MRPEILFPLFADVTSLKGVGASLAKALERLEIRKIIDLLFHLPTGMLHRTRLESLHEAKAGMSTILTVRITEHDAPRNPRAPMRVAAVDQQGWPITLSFFSNPSNYVQKMLPLEAQRVVSGTLEQYQGGWQIVHPDHMLAPEKADQIAIEEPVYPLTEGLGNKRLRTLLEQAYTRVPILPEWIDPALMRQKGWPGWHTAIAEVHHLGLAKDSLLARERLGYDELLANQLALALLRNRLRKRRARALVGDGQHPVSIALPFSLTGAQTRAVAEILTDMESDKPMLRLLQGDVGSGKTVVALLAAARAAGHGGQTALLAPTEILARQHLATFEKIGGLRVALLTARDKGRAREAILAELATGRIDVIIGTHALFTEDVRFQNLVLVVVDEQHRFGVHQRLALAQKAAQPPHMLVMSATPIPRTLTLTVYGELDISQIQERPPGRQPIDTRVVALDRLEEVYDGLARALAQGGRAYWVCPLVEESQKVDLAAADARAAHLQQRFGDQVALVHGRMRAAEKDAAMQAFAKGDKRVLVATTVIEVGVDVPEANLMIIEQAERFGLAQLHQLRGRVGRDSQQSICLLLRGTNLGEAGAARLRILRETDDGFRIAEEDLRLRGAGELLGTRQSGLPAFRLVDPAVAADLMLLARDDARVLLQRDPDLSSPRGEAARVLLYLFERDAAAALLRSG